MRIRVRLSEDRAAAPTAAIIDSASVRGAETVGADTRGYTHWMSMGSAGLGVMVTWWWARRSGR